MAPSWLQSGLPPCSLLTLEPAPQGCDPVTMPDHGLFVIGVYDKSEGRAVGHLVEQRVKSFDLGVTEPRR